jgi:hypothetical protein
MAKKTVKCPVIGCSYETAATFECEEVIMPFTMKISELERIAPIAVGRNFRLHCPTHGDKIAQVFGHHVTHIPKKSSKKRKK